MKVKQEKGVTLVALTITIVMLLILTGFLIYNAQDSVYMKKLTNLYNDIDLLRGKVSSYYNQYGKLPAKVKYNNTAGLTEVLNDKIDTGDFYVIDLEAMQGITLNYGKDYDKIKQDQNNVDNYFDVYIVNENSHNIFYVSGVKIKENDRFKTYYTDYITADNIQINLRYIDGVMIPQNYYYLGKNQSGEIVISNIQDENIDESKESQYIWQKQTSRIVKKLTNVLFNDSQTENEFIKSVNFYKGYFKNSKNKVQYASIDENKWSEPYTKEMQYTDVNGKSVTIPEGYRVNLSPVLNDVDEGLVVKDSNDIEWIWVEVPGSVFRTVENNTDYESIAADLERYAQEYLKQSTTKNKTISDNWTSSNEISSEEEHTKLFNKMLGEIYQKNGFWVSKDLVSKNNTNQMLFDLQWGLLCKFIGINSSLSYNDIQTNSNNWGNFKNLFNANTSGNQYRVTIY